MINYKKFNSEQMFGFSMVYSYILYIGSLHILALFTKSPQRTNIGKFYCITKSQNKKGTYWHASWPVPVPMQK